MTRSDCLRVNTTRSAARRDRISGSDPQFARCPWRWFSLSSGLGENFGERGLYGAPSVAFRNAGLPGAPLCPPEVCHAVRHRGRAPLTPLTRRSGRGSIFSFASTTIAFIQTIVLLSLSKLCPTVARRFWHFSLFARVRRCLESWLSPSPDLHP